MKGILKIVIALIAVAAVAVTGVVVVNNINSPKKTLERFAECYNAMDFDGMASCFDPETQSLYFGVNAFTEELFGFNVNELGEFAAAFAEFDEEGEIPEQPQMEIEVNDWDKYDDTTAWVDCTMTLTMGDELVQETGRIDMVKIEDEWYISGAEMLESLF